ncbi:hypothetical protein ACQKWADRAFT_286880 [Trichoderma austrokoningii]
MDSARPSDFFFHQSMHASGRNARQAGHDRLLLATWYMMRDEGAEYLYRKPLRSTINIISRGLRSKATTGAKMRCKQPTADRLIITTAAVDAAVGRKGVNRKWNQSIRVQLESPVMSRCGRNGCARKAARVGQKPHCTIKRSGSTDPSTPLSPGTSGALGGPGSVVASNRGPGVWCLCFLPCSPCHPATFYCPSLFCFLLSVILFSNLSHYECGIRCAIWSVKGPECCASSGTCAYTCHAMGPDGKPDF